ncbi:MAG: hypothetical protein SGBAC_012876, partial [Bacillariaceae sp.]
MTQDSSSSDNDDDSDVDDRAYRIVEGTQEKQKEKDARSAGHSTATPGAHSSSSSKGHSAAGDKKRRGDTAPGAQAGSSFMDKSRQSKELRNSSKGNNKKENQNNSRPKHGGGSKNGSRSRHGSNDGNRRHRSRGNDRSPHRRDHNNASNNNTAGTAQPCAPATSGTVELEAQVVRENSEENMNIALQQENERLRQQLDVTTAAATVAHTEPKESHSEGNNGGICSKKTAMIVAFVLALIGAGAGAFFATQGVTSSSPSSSAVQVDVATSPPT